MAYVLCPMVFCVVVDVNLNRKSRKVAGDFVYLDALENLKENAFQNKLAV